MSPSITRRRSSELNTADESCEFSEHSARELQPEQEFCSGQEPDHDPDPA